ncbi:MAG: hypothetical protein ACFFDP_09020 [Promethearchaeota archaeon]
MMLFQIITASLLTDIASFLVEVIVGTFAFYGAGRMIAGIEAKYTDAFYIAFIGLLLQLGIDSGIDYCISYFFAGVTLNQAVLLVWRLVALLATFIAWMILVQHFFDCLFTKGLFIIAIAFVVIVVLDYILGFAFDLVFSYVLPAL